MIYYEYTFYPLFIISIIFSIWAQFKVNSTYNRYSSFVTKAGMNATDIARMMLSEAGLTNVNIGRVRGNLTDHFDPKSNTLALSDTTFASYSAAAIGVAAHEAGHAIQHAEGYFPIKLRSALVPVTGFASKTSFIFIILGGLFVMFSADGILGYNILLAGIGLFAVTTLFQLVTLPCEFNASRRAMTALRASGRFSEDELFAARNVLFAAAMTYVAASFASIVQLLRLLLIFGNRRGRR